MKEVFLLWFTGSPEQLRNEDNEILIGVYSSQEKAQEAKGRAQLLNGFKDNPDGFEICPFNIDEDGWASGFSIV